MQRKAIRATVGGVDVDISIGALSSGQLLTYNGSQITSTPPGAAFSIATDIAPLHRWRASGNVQTGGLVDSITDVGSSPKNFIQIFGARAPVATDADGDTYLALDGVADFYQAGAVGDWNFLHTGAPWTIAIVYHRTAQTATEELLDTCDHNAANAGMSVFLQFGGAGAYGPAAVITAAVVAQSCIAVQSLESNSIGTIKQLIVFRMTGDNSGTIPLGDRAPSPIDMILRRLGMLVSTGSKSAHAFSGAASAFTLTLGRRANTAGQFSAARIYEILIDNKAWSDRQIEGAEAELRSTYHLTRM